MISAPTISAEAAAELSVFTTTVSEMLVELEGSTLAPDALVHGALVLVFSTGLQRGLSEDQLVALVESAALQAIVQASGGKLAQYAVALLDPSGTELAGMSFPAHDDDAANDEARMLALSHEWARKARVRCVADCREWLLEVRP